MALGATIYVFEIELANSDRGIYHSFTLRVARHPSEAEDYLMTRVIAYCMEYAEGIAFSKGLSDPDEPAISIRDLTGVLQTWIDIGAPEAARLHRASKAAPRVVVFVHKDVAQFVARLAGEKIHRSEALEIYAVDREWLANLVARLSRRMVFTLTVADQHLYLSIGEETLATVINRVALRA